MIKLPNLLLTPVILALCACATTDVIKQNTASDKDVKPGIPYNLPKTTIEVELALSNNNNNEQSLQLSARTKRVPDENAVYVINPETQSWLVSNNHHFVLENGLIKSIDTVDTGETGVVIENTTNTLINFAKSAVLSAQSTEEQPFLEFQSTPTEAELRAMAKMLLGGSVKFSFDPKFGSTMHKEVPGTNGLLYLKTGRKSKASAQTKNFLEKNNNVTFLSNNQDENHTNLPKKTPENKPESDIKLLIKNLTDSGNNIYNKIVSSSENSNESDQKKNEKKSDNNNDIPPSNNPTPAIKEGLFARTLKGFDLTTRLYVNLHKLRRIRAEKMYQQFRKELNELINLVNLKEKLEQEKESLTCKDTNNIKIFEKQIAQLSVLNLYSESKISKEQIIARTGDLKEQLIELKNKKQKCDLADKTIRDSNPNIQSQYLMTTSIIHNLHLVEKWDLQNNESFLVANSEETLQVTSQNAIPIPLTRASIGETTNKLKFDKGILIDFHQIKPSEGKVLTEALVNASSALYDGVEAIVQLPAKALGFQLEEVQAKQNLTDAQTALINKQKRAKIEEILLDAKTEAVLADPAAHMGLLDNMELDGEENSEDAEEDNNDDSEAVANDQGGESSESEDTCEQTTEATDEEAAEETDEEVTEQQDATSQQCQE